jgi:hypothetical protein
VRKVGDVRINFQFPFEIALVGQTFNGRGNLGDLFSDVSLARWSCDSIVKLGRL